MPEFSCKRILRGFNDGLPAMARARITQRRDASLWLTRAWSPASAYRLASWPGAITYTAPQVRRKIAPKMPPSTSGTFKPEPILEEAEYQHILEVIESMVKVMERSPKDFHHINEETLRSHFLVQLNGQYEGQATGETFNSHGKTDILVRSDDRNIFIAECKFWGGPLRN